MQPFVVHDEATPLIASNFIKLTKSDFRSLSQ